MYQTTASLHSNHPQRSPEWHTERIGKFTSSKASVLLGEKGLGEMGKTYALQLAVDIVEGIDYDARESSMTWDMKNGIETEPFAFDKFKHLKSLDFIDVVNCGFFTLNKDVGGSPDGLVGNDAVLEIKCPKSDTFFKLVKTLEIDKAHYNQVQHQMWVSGKERAYYFNYVLHIGVEKWHEIIIQRDEKVIDLLKKRTIEAIEIRNDYIEVLKKNRQYK